MVSTAVPVDVYLRSSFEPDAEYVDGEIQERPAGQYDHADRQSALIDYFRQHKLEWNVRIEPARLQSLKHSILLCFLFASIVVRC